MKQREIFQDDHTKENRDYPGTLREEKRRRRKIIKVFRSCSLLVWDETLETLSILW